MGRHEGTPPANCRVVSLRQAILGGGEEAIIDGALIGEWPEEAEGLLEPNPGIAEKGGFRVGRGPREAYTRLCSGKSI